HRALGGLRHGHRPLARHAPRLAGLQRRDGGPHRRLRNLYPGVRGGKMKTIGLIGGMSWESTQTYYRLINQGVKARLGGLHSARLVLYSVDFAEIEALQRRGDWAATAQILGAAARSLSAAGADFLVLCTNTM